MGKDLGLWGPKTDMLHGCQLGGGLRLGGPGGADQAGTQGRRVREGLVTQSRLGAPPRACPGLLTPTQQIQDIGGLTGPKEPWQARLQVFGGHGRDRGGCGVVDETDAQFEGADKDAVGRCQRHGLVRWQGLVGLVDKGAVAAEVGDPDFVAAALDHGMLARDDALGVVQKDITVGAATNRRRAGLQSQLT